MCYIFVGKTILNPAGIREIDAIYNAVNSLQCGPLPLFLRTLYIIPSLDFYCFAGINACCNRRGVMGGGIIQHSRKPISLGSFNLPSAAGNAIVSCIYELEGERIHSFIYIYIYIHSYFLLNIHFRPLFFGT